MASKSKQRKLEDYIKDELGTHKWKSIGYAAGGCINEGQSFDTDQGKIFIKFNTKAEVRKPKLRCQLANPCSSIYCICLQVLHTLFEFSFFKNFWTKTLGKKYGAYMRVAPKSV